MNGDYKYSLVMNSSMISRMFSNPTMQVYIILLTILTHTSSLDTGQNPSGLIIQIQYTSLNASNVTNNNSQINTIYENNILSSAFNMNQNFFDCSNTNLFILNQTSVNSYYNLTLANYTQDLLAIVQIGYDNPNVTNTSCSPPNCTITINSLCTDSYFNSLVTGIVKTSSGNIITKFKYYFQCNFSQFLQTFIIQWGFIILTLSSIPLIWVSSKFQSANSYNNFSFYVNYVVVAIYCALVLTKFLLYYYQFNNIMLVVDYICIMLSFIFGSLCVMVCFCQFIYLTKLKYFHRGIKINQTKIRVMDILGLLLGIGLLCAWFFSNKNFIISDIIFLMMYITFIKFVKFGSLKILLVLYGVNFIILVIFYRTVEFIDSSYEDSSIIYFNNPMFLLFPNINRIPNSKCAWYSLLSMSYGGFFLAYLSRFDKNISSMVYSITFIGSYTFGSILWLIVSGLTPFLILYESFTIPISVALLLLFAYRRGEILNLWNGQFYDERRMSISNKKQMKQLLKKKPNRISYAKSLFQNLKYDQKQKDISFDSSIKQKESCKNTSRIANDSISYQIQSIQLSVRDPTWRTQFKSSKNEMQNQK